MKSLIASVLISASLLSINTVMAEPSPQSDCSIRKNGNYTGEVIKWNQFFSRVDQYSRNNGCSVGKISYTSGSGRMYIDGRKIGSNLSNNEVKNLKRQYGYSDFNCPTFTCDETGYSQPTYPTPYPPTYPGDNYACIDKVMNKGYSPSTAKSSCSSLTSSSELDCVSMVLNHNYGPSHLQSTCRSASYSEVQCMRKILNKGYSPSTAKNTCR